MVGPQFVAWWKNFLKGTVEKCKKREGDRNGHLWSLTPVPAALQVSSHEPINNPVSWLLSPCYRQGNREENVPKVTQLVIIRCRSKPWACLMEIWRGGPRHPEVGTPVCLRPPCLLQVHPRQLWLKPLTPSLPGALLCEQSGPWHQPWREPKPPTTPGSGPGIPAAFPKSLSFWDLGQPWAQGLSSQLAHPKGLARGDFTLHTQTVRTEPASVAQSLQTDLTVREGSWQCIISASSLIWETRTQSG